MRVDGGTGGDAAWRSAASGLSRPARARAQAFFGGPAVQPGDDGAIVARVESLPRTARSGRPCAARECSGSAAWAPTDPARLQGVQAWSLRGSRPEKPAASPSDASARAGTAEYIDLAAVTAMNLSGLPGFLEGLSRGAIDEMFRRYFPGGQPEILEDWDVRAFIQAAIAKRQIQAQAGIPYDFPLAPGIVVSRRV